MRGHPPTDISVPNPARVYDCLLGGTDNFPADQQAAARLLDPETGYPGLAGLAITNRVFLSKAVTMLSGRGVRQFLDLGCGLPVCGRAVAGPDGRQVILRDIHETARLADPLASVVYLDRDPMVVSHTSAVLPDSTSVAALRGDLRCPRDVLRDGGVWWMIDETKPVAVILGTVLHFSDAEEAAGIVAGYASALPAGSAVVISHAWYCPALRERLAAVSSAPWHNHSDADVQAWFDAAGLTLVRQRVADVRTWPLLGDSRNREAMVIGGIGIKA